MKRWIRMPRLLFAALALVAAALAAGCARSPEGRAQMAVDFAADYLELEKEQEAPLVALKDLYLKHAPKYHELRREAHEAVEEALESEHPDTAAVIAAFKKQQAFLDRIAPQVVDQIIALHKSMTPEQKELVAGHLERVHGHLRVPKPGRMLRRVERDLKLDAAQANQLQALVKETLADFDKVKPRLDAVVEQALAQLRGPAIDRAWALNAIAERGRLMDEYAPRIANRVAAFHAGLNEDQREEIADFAASHHRGMWRHGGGHGFGHGARMNCGHW